MLSEIEPFHSTDDARSMAIITALIDFGSIGIPEQTSPVSISPA